MNRYMTEEEILKHHGEPVLRFKPHGEFTEYDINIGNVPDEVMVVKIDHVSEFMVFSYYNGWVCNNGERWVIRELLKRLDTA